MKIGDFYEGDDAQDYNTAYQRLMNWIMQHDAEFHREIREQQVDYAQSRAQLLDKEVQRLRDKYPVRNQGVQS